MLWLILMPSIYPPLLQIQVLQETPYLQPTGHNSHWSLVLQASPQLLLPGVRWDATIGSIRLCPSTHTLKSLSQPHNLFLGLPVVHWIHKVTLMQPCVNIASLWMAFAECWFTRRVSHLPVISFFVSRIFQFSILNPGLKPLMHWSSCSGPVDTLSQILNAILSGLGRLSAVIQSTHLWSAFTVHRLCLCPFCRIGEVGISLLGFHEMLCQSHLVWSSKDSLFSGWSNRMAAFRQSNACL